MGTPAAAWAPGLVLAATQAEKGAALPRLRPKTRRPTPPSSARTGSSLSISPNTGRMDRRELQHRHGRHHRSPIIRRWWRRLKRNQFATARRATRQTAPRRAAPRRGRRQTVLPEKNEPASPPTPCKKMNPGMHCIPLRSDPPGSADVSPQAIVRPAAGEARLHPRSTAERGMKWM